MIADEELRKLSVSDIERILSERTGAYARDEILQFKCALKRKKEKEQKDRRLFIAGLYITAFFLPILGVVMGLIYVRHKEETLGKSLVIFSSVVLIVIFLGSYFLLYGRISEFIAML